MRVHRLLVALVLALASCAAPKPSPEVAHDLGVQFQTPAGWEHLDHGRQQLFRAGESQISLTAHRLEPDSMAARAADPDPMLLRIALGAGFNAERYEIAHQEVRVRGGMSWTELETWSRLTHTQRRRIAYARRGEVLLVLDLDRGDAAKLSNAFEALLASIEPVDRKE